MIRRRVVVHGLVQGVFFRESCRQEAARRGVTGWVINRPDETVEAVFQGLESDVDAMIAWCRTGPSRAQVTGVDVTAEEPQRDSGFHVR